MKCEDALLLLPTGLRTYTFNTTRTSTDMVKYQLPRREPRGESSSSYHCSGAGWIDSVCGSFSDKFGLIYAL